MNPGKIFIIHFNPINRYPPAMNLLRYLQINNPGNKNIYVFSSRDPQVKIENLGNNIKVVESGFDPDAGRLSRLISYILFNLKVLSELIWHRPQTVLYIESLSAWAALIYKKYIQRKSRLLVHYHEYHTPGEFASGMAVIRYFHKMEIPAYPLMTWVSHTNSKRLEMFLNDIGNPKLQNIAVLPNYPPSQWYQVASKVAPQDGSTIRLVYVGALSLDTTYISQVANFVASNKSFSLDIFSNNIETGTYSFLNKLNASNIYLKGVISYNDLPATLPQYDVGLIIYKGNTANFEFNAPNKFFEYVACGLNIVFADGMKGMYEFENYDGTPWIRKVNFNTMNAGDFAKAKRKGNSNPDRFIAENELRTFTTILLNDHN